MHLSRTLISARNGTARIIRTGWSELATACDHLACLENREFFVWDGEPPRYRIAIAMSERVGFFLREGAGIGEKGD